MSSPEKHFSDNRLIEQERVSKEFQDLMSIEKTPFLRYLVNKNPLLEPILTDYFQRKKPIILIGGESSMGKSLLTGVLRDANDKFFPESGGKALPLTVITWDRMNKMMYDQISIALGTTVNPPDGEVPYSIRSYTGLVMAKTIHFANRNRRAGENIIVESPFLFNRGEKVFQQFPDLQGLSNMVYMYSPESRQLALMSGRRDTKTAGQIPSMTGMRKTILKEIYGNDLPNLSDTDQEAVIEQWLAARAEEVKGLVVRWNPREIPDLFHETRRVLIGKKISPDYMYPSSIGWYAMHELESAVKRINNLEEAVFSS